jgi:hypothetical protein
MLKDVPNAILLVLLLSAGAWAGETNPTPAPEPKAEAQVDARADALVRRMSDFLAATPSFALEAEETYDEQPEDGPRQQLTTKRRVAVKRPDKAVGDASGDAFNRSFWYDGKALSVLDRQHNTYVVAAVPDKLETMLDFVFDRTGLEFPLADFFYGDVYKTLMEDVGTGAYLGIHEAAGVPCHHLAFEQDGLDWQLWIDAGEKPLPRKLLLAYTDEEGVPQYTAVIRKWNLKPSLPEELFRFDVPPGAEKVVLPMVSEEAPKEPSPEPKGQVEKEEKPQ